MPQDFPPARRIRRRGEFQRVFEAGRRLHGRWLTVVAAPAPDSHTRFGIVASRKVGGAVQRNRAKRLIRQIFRTSDGPASGYDLVVILKPGTADADLASLTEDYRSTLRRLEKSKK